MFPPAALTALLGSWGRTDPHLVNPSKSLRKFSTSFFFLYFSLFFFKHLLEQVLAFRFCPIPEG